MADKKLSLPPETVLFPLPTVLLTAEREGAENIITLAWAGVVCSSPPMVSVSIRPSRYSHGMVAASGEFGLNIPTASLLEKVDLCGMVSGKAGDKFAAAGLTRVPAETIKAPLIAECPVSLECAVRHTLRLGSHDMFIAEVLRVRADRDRIEEGRRVAARDGDGIAYFPGTQEYRRTGETIGRYGFTRGKKGK